MRRIRVRIQIEALEKFSRGRTLADTARDLREGVAEPENGLLGQAARTTCDTDAEILVSVHHDAVVRLDEEVRDARGDVGEESGRVAAGAPMIRNGSQRKGRKRRRTR